MGLLDTLKMFSPVARKTAAKTGGDRDGSDYEFELSQVGPYKIIAPIGSGGMGIVYKALDPVKDETIAIKVLHKTYDLDKKRRKRDYLGREIMIAASLNHPAIIKMNKEIVIQEDNEGNLRRCLLMELIDGYNMKYFIENRILTIKQMINLCIRLCEGLDFLHQHGVVHRDIKPANFLFSRDGKQLKIVDFGLSKSTSNWRMRWVKETGGTRLYMSPEQIRKKSLDHRSDIFSFGITMFELFTGRHPCNGMNPKQITRQIVSSSYQFPAPSSINHEIPEKLDRVILKCLRRDINRRYQSCTELVLDLNRVFESQSRI
ncbi:MAG: serine/threonine protein kinase [Candidatus Hydrogenedentes bacterium]|nr:serine/threonine protein kinase [Candidatus Hydrogenedentota bacterium]